MPLKRFAMVNGFEYHLDVVSYKIILVIMVYLDLNLDTLYYDN